MPVYEYFCQCGYETTEIQKMGAESPKCLSCGGEMKRKMSPSAIIKVIGHGGYPVRSRGYKDGYSKEYLRDVAPETQ